MSAGERQDPEGGYDVISVNVQPEPATPLLTCITFHLSHVYILHVLLHIDVI